MDSPKHNVTIKKIANDPKWSEVIKLYSGLFDDDKERTELIYNLIVINPDLAVECKLSSSKEEPQITSKLRNHILNDTRGFKNPKVFTINLISLLKIYEPKDLLELIKIKRRYVKRLCLLIVDENYSIIWELLFLFANERKHSQRLLWFLEFLPSKSLPILTERDKMIYHNVCNHLNTEKRLFHYRRLKNIIDK
jgi:hypothetical protein